MKLTADGNDLLSPYGHAKKIRAHNVMDKVIHQTTIHFGGPTVTVNTTVMMK